MSNARSDDLLERWLREDAQRALPDDGFNARVMAALPAHARRQNPWLKPALVLGSAVVGSALAAAFAPGDASAIQGFIDLAQMRGFTPAAITGLALSAALLACALVLAADPD